LFVGEVAGVDVGWPIDAAMVAAINQAIDRYTGPMYRAKELDDEQTGASAGSTQAEEARVGRLIEVV
jgi:hypothetical protein